MAIAARGHCTRARPLARSPAPLQNKRTEHKTKFQPTPDEFDGLFAGGDDSD